MSVSILEQRRDFLRQSTAGGLGLLGGNMLLADDTSPFDPSAIDRSMSAFELNRQYAMPKGFQFTGDSMNLERGVTHVHQFDKKTPEYGFGTSLAQANSACITKLASGEAHKAVVYMPQVRMTDDKPEVFYGEPVVYRDADEVAQTSQYDRMRNRWTDQIALVDDLQRHSEDRFLSDVSFSDRIAMHDLQFTADPGRSMYVSTASDLKPGVVKNCGNCHSKPKCGCGVTYSPNCGDCRTDPLSIVGGMFRGEMFQRVRLRDDFMSLSIRQRIFARIVPRMAMRRGLIGPCTARILLVQRLFVIVVTGIIVGTAGIGGGAAAGVIFIP